MMIKRKINFVSKVPELENVEICKPKPAISYLPDWFKLLPNKLPNGMTAKQCPSFVDLFKLAYVVPMWCDVNLQRHNKDYSWETAHPEFTFDIHQDGQFSNYIPKDNYGVFKANSPWLIYTPPGWSVMQLPMYYHFNSDWEVLPGIIYTDQYHENNQQIMLFKDNVTIKQGEPLCMYVPYKREKTKQRIWAMNKYWWTRHRKSKLLLASQFDYGYNRNRNY
jgi:hypothetical protein